MQQKINYVRFRTLTEIYIKALLIDEDLADRVWPAWDVGEIDDLTACLGWLRVATEV